MLRLFSFAIALALSLPCTALAQTPPPESGVDAVPPPPLVSAPDEAPPPEEEPPPPAFVPSSRVTEADAEANPGTVAGRAAVEVLGGGVGTLGGGLLGLIVGSAVSGNCSLFDEGLGDCTPFLVGGLSGMALGSSLGVYAAGRLMDGRGQFFSTLVGGVLGTAASILFLAIQDDTVSAVGFFAAPAVGSILGFELSALVGPSHEVSLSVRRASPPRWLPSLRVTPRGDVVGGIGGRF